MIQEIPITTLEQAQILREIRNELRQYMTRDTKFITPDTQAQWFKTYILSDGAAYLYRNEYDCIVGYGYVRVVDDKAWGSLAVKPEFQGRGYGTQIYKHMIAIAGELWIEIYADNVESLGAAVKAGFVMVDTQDKIVVLRGSV